MKYGLSLFWLFCFISLAANFASAQDKNTVGVITEFSGAVERKKDGAQKPELITAKTKDLSLHQNDTVATGKDGTAKIALSEGSVITLGPKTTIVLKKASPDINIELKTGKVRVDCKSELVTLVTPYYSFTGKGASLEVGVPQPNEVTVFCIEGSPTVTGPNGLQILPREGQMFSIKYDKERKLFSVKADEYNEEELYCKAKGREHKIPPGNSLWFDTDLNLTVIIPPELPMMEEAKDKPYEDAGDIYQLPVVSPKKP